MHDAIFRLRKQLAEALGKKYKIGIRGIEVELSQLECRLTTSSGCSKCLI
ncbi:Seryl-tRNA synthetase, archaeal [Methanosarcina barkeri 227]|uniref:Seryl-tRNA synthetase, archaeal n=1 Tax=Methanosarcina barkeri 227 TaxID=1434106 RepID=A0A0E3R560_METBA|nr:Seryl-tRNA synthetase, archaeal [Methanosarcina barkeri 227]